MGLPGQDVLCSGTSQVAAWQERAEWRGGQTGARERDRSGAVRPANAGGIWRVGAEQRNDRA